MREEINKREGGNKGEKTLLTRRGILKMERKVRGTDRRNKCEEMEREETRGKGKEKEQTKKGEAKERN